jgi:hypothetical protein
MEIAVQLKDRKGLLIFLGVIQIIFGVISALIFLLSIIGLLFMSNPDLENSRQINPSSAVLGSLFYMIMAVVFVVLGIGSIQTRKWARALSLVLSWFTFLMGVFVFIILFILLPGILDRMPLNENYNPVVMTLAKVFIYSFILIFLVLLPGVFILAYQSKSVVATVQKYNPKQSWTDKYPLPIIAVSFMVFFHSMVPLFSAINGWVMLFFGIILTGIPTVMLLLLNAVFCIYLGIQIYKLKLRIWYYLIGFYSFWILSFMVSLLFRNILDVYQHMNIPSAQIEMIENMGIFTNTNMFIFSFILIIPSYFFLFYIKKYFKKEEPLLTT